MLRSLAASLAVLGLASSAAAVTIADSISADFGDTFADRTAAPPDTTRVRAGIGFLIDQSDPMNPTAFSDPFDYVALTDLVPGSTFTLFAQVFVGEDTGLTVLDGVEGLVLPEVVFDERDPQTLTGTVPSSGTIVFRIRPVTSDSDYLTPIWIDIDAPRVVPEPATALLIALGLAGLAARRRSN